MYVLELVCMCVCYVCVCVLWVRMRVQKYTEQKEVRIHTTILTIKGNCVCPRYQYLPNREQVQHERRMYEGACR